jgi:hypothetical protein
MPVLKYIQIKLFVLDYMELMSKYLFIATFQLSVICKSMLEVLCMKMFHEFMFENALTISFILQKYYANFWGKPRISAE